MANKTLFCSFYVSFCTFCTSLRLTRTVFTRPKTSAISASKNLCNLLLKICAICGKNQHNPRLKVRPKGLHSFIFYILIFAFSLTSYGINSTKDYVRKNNLFMQNEPKFQKVKLNVNNVLTTDYDQLDTWSIRKNEPKTNPNEPKTNPIKANQSQLKPKQSQFKPNSNPNKPNFKSPKSSGLQSRHGDREARLLRRRP